MSKSTSDDTVEIPSEFTKIVYANLYPPPRLGLRLYIFLHFFLWVYFLHRKTGPYPPFITI